MSSNTKKPLVWVISGLLVLAVIAGAILYITTFSPTARFEKQMDLGNRYLDAGSFDEAILAFNAAIEINPKNYDTYIGLGDAYAANENYESAVQAYEAALDFDTSNENTYLKLSDAYCASQDYVSAIDILKKGIDATDSQNLSKQIAVIMEKMGITNYSDEEIASNEYMWSIGKADTVGVFDRDVVAVYDAESKTMTISKNGLDSDGVMGEFKYASSPWVVDDPEAEAMESTINYIVDIETLVIKTGVNNIGKGAFIYCDSLKNTIIENGVTSIDDAAFVGCFEMSSITIPNSVTRIGNGAFAECNSLTVIVPSSVTDMGEDVFSVWAHVSYESAKAVTNSDSNKPQEIDIFSELSDDFIFASGAGGWSTVVKIKPDGTFTGSYQDSDMGVTGTDYPHGTRYECNFSGKFTEVIAISDYEYSMKIEYINTEGIVGEEKIIDSVKVITSEPYGFENADEFLLYLPGRTTADLPEEFLGWVSSPMGWGSEVPAVLPFYGLYNVGGKEGFYSAT